MMIHLHAAILDDCLRLVSEQRKSSWLLDTLDRHKVALQSEVAETLFVLSCNLDTAMAEPHSNYKAIYGHAASEERNLS